MPSTSRTADDSGPHGSRQAYAWPDADPALIARVLAGTPPAFDVSADLGLTAAAVLPALFKPGELVCVGANSRRAVVRPLEVTLADAHLQQFIVLNPMRGVQALNYRGRLSARCQNNVGTRRYLVAESDDRSLSKPQQAQLIAWLSQFAPLVMAVDSGGDSLHAWFRIDQFCRRDQARFFAVACLLGADPSRWDSCGWLRMPGGLRQSGRSPAHPPTHPPFQSP